MRLINRSILITGCSSGIGLGLAKVLRENKWKVYPAVKSDKDAFNLREIGFKPIVLDVTSSDSTKQAVDTVISQNKVRLGRL